MKKNYILLLLLCLCFAGCKEKTVVESDYLPTVSYTHLTLPTTERV